MIIKYQNIYLLNFQENKNVNGEVMVGKVLEEWKMNEIYNF